MTNYNRIKINDFDVVNHNHLTMNHDNLTMEGGDDNMNYDHGMKDVHIGKNKTIIYFKVYPKGYFEVYPKGYFHIMKDHDHMIMKDISNAIRNYCVEHNYSYGFYSSGVGEDTNSISNVEDLDGEFSKFKEVFESTFSTDDYVYFIGHSYGSCFAKYFGMKYHIPSISLNGSDLYIAVPYFIGLHLNEDVKAEDMEWNEKSFVYKGVNYYGNEDIGLSKLYCDMMWKCDIEDTQNDLNIRNNLNIHVRDIPTHIIINYAPNKEHIQDNPEEVKLIHVFNKYYRNCHELCCKDRINNDYICSSEVVKTIFETFIEYSTLNKQDVTNYLMKPYEETIEHALINRLTLNRTHFDTYHMISMMLRDPKRYKAIVEKYKSTDISIDDDKELHDVEELHSIQNVKDPLEKRYLRLKLRNIKPEVEYQNLKKWCRNNSKVIPTLYRGERTDRFKNVTVGDTIEFTELFSSSEDETYAKWYITNGTVMVKDKDAEAILIIFKNLSAAHLKLPFDKKTVYRVFTNKETPHNNFTWNEINYEMPSNEYLSLQTKFRITNIQNVQNIIKIYVE